MKNKQRTLLHELLVKVPSVDAEYFRNISFKLDTVLPPGVSRRAQRSTHLSEKNAKLGLEHYQDPF
jgi:hypothetical protein